MSVSRTAGGEAPPIRLYVARWPDGTAMLVSASSMADVANRLDEVGDPGTCEVVPYDGQLALTLRPARMPDREFCLDVSLDALDDAHDVQRLIMSTAFPVLHRMMEETRDEKGEAQIDPAVWPAAVAREVARELAPSIAWANAIAEWWEEMSGERADQSAAARDMMNVTIPGEPRPTPEVRALFEAEQRRIRARIDCALGSSAVPKEPRERVGKKAGTVAKAEAPSRSPRSGGGRTGAKRPSRPRKRS